MSELLAMEMFIARVLGMHGHRHVPQHRFETGSSDDDLFVRTNNFISKFGEHGELVLCATMARDRAEFATIEFQDGPPRGRRWLI